MLLYGLPDSTLKILQRVGNYAARIITRLGRSEHITPVLHDIERSSNIYAASVHILFCFILIKHNMTELFHIIVKLFYFI